MNAPPNILLITDDQHRFDFFEGGPVESLRTPNLSRLMRKGTTLDRAYSSCPLCVPTRFTWLYGLRGSQGNGAWGEHDDRWPTHLRSMGHVLQGHGYHTALIGKLHSHSGLRKLDLLDHVDQTHARGFDDVVEMSGRSLVKWFDCTYTHHLAERGLLDEYRRRLEELGPNTTAPLPFDKADSMDGVIGHHARRWLESYDGDQPYFLHASFCGPHFPYDPVPEYAERFKPADMPKPIGVEDPERVKYFQLVMARYCALIEQIDEEAGRLLDLLERRGELDNTIVIFGSDHGDMMGHRNRLGKSTPYDTSARTPIVVRHPDAVPAGRVLSDRAESVDLPCSILEAAGAAGQTPGDALPGSPGRSWWGYVTGERDEHRRWAYSEMGPWKMVCDDQWKYVHRSDGEAELFDLAGDPFEMNNLAGDAEQGDRVRQMQAWIIESMSAAVAPPTEHPDLTLRH